MIAPVAEGAILTGNAINIPLRKVSVTQYRPLGKGEFTPSPWREFNGPEEEYIPTHMAVRNIRVGLAKAMEEVKTLPEDLVLRAQNFIVQKLKNVIIDAPDNLVTSYEEALTQLSLNKSSGYPYYFDAPTKLLALERHSEVIQQRVGSILNGEAVPSVFSLTLKSELRESVKVHQDKTRVFMAGDMHHLLASIQLFSKMNDKIMETRVSEHPITIGIQLPGPEFVNAVTKLGKELNDGDVSGCDLRFPLRIARSVRDIKKCFLPNRFWAAVDNLYDSVYCGHVAVLGAIYRLDGNKSGWFNTGIDNSICTWEELLIACFAIWPDLEDFFNALINGDDILVAMGSHLGPYAFKRCCDYLRSFNIYIEADNWLARRATSVVYLSHHLEKRFVPQIGDFYVAAGNLPKLKSSLNWIKRSPTLSFPESCVAHLIGLRICLFPWALEFEECDAILSRYLSTIVLTPFIRQCLSARLSEVELSYLHTRMEAASFFTAFCMNQVVKGTFRLINCTCDDEDKVPETKKWKSTINYQSTTTASRQYCPWNFAPFATKTYRGGSTSKSFTQV